MSATAISFEDAGLLEQCRQGELSAFARLVAKYQDRIYNACWRICGHREDARDLTQQTFANALESIGTFRGSSSFYTWLFRIAVNLAISHQRSQARTASLSLDSPTDRDGRHQASSLAARLPNPGSLEPHDQLGRRELHSLVARALQNLDEEHRVVVVLRDIEGFDYQQIAEILQVAVGTVKSRLHRARMALRQQLAAVIGSA